ncbi:tryptophan 7-halogenase [Burkholderia sp. Bp8963]|uniref:tryptophan 7-halogenase n=1 Tax=Burkholderia sp. Bp8963 TaxID=2184547 RepID=UPI00163A3138|nr:tryptophan 7-halogenase [Burkholderia sp. Bp8963]
MTADRDDVLIVGAGPAGCATALALDAAGCRVALLDRPSTQSFRVGESATPDVAGLLRRLGVDDRLERAGHAFYHGNLSLWGDDQPRVDHFLFRGTGHGWHLDRAAFDAQLRDAARARGIAVRSCAGVEAIMPTSDGWAIRARGIGEVHARVLVDAGGRRSPLAAWFGVRRRSFDGMVALAAHASHARELAGLSLVESFEDGWWYAVGLPDGQALVTLMTDRDVATARRFRDPDVYRRAWQDTRLLAKHVPPGPAPAAIHVFAAHSGCIERSSGGGWIAVGDALMGLDPLTSSGIAGALSDGLAAAPAVVDMLAGRPDGAIAYAARANAVFGRYLAERVERYGTESRWSQRAFWARRGHGNQVAAAELAEGCA